MSNLVLEALEITIIKIDVGVRDSRWPPDPPEGYVSIHYAQRVKQTAKTTAGEAQIAA